MLIGRQGLLFHSISCCTIVERMSGETEMREERHAVVIICTYQINPVFARFFLTMCIKSQDIKWIFKLV